MFSSAIILGVIFLLLEANTFLECIINVYVTAVSMVCCIAFTTILFKKENLFELINDLEQFIDRSECLQFKAYEIE